MTKIKEIEEIIKKSQKLSIYTLREMYKSLDLDSNELHQTIPKTRFRKLNSNNIGEYASETNEIILNDKLIPMIARRLKQHEKNKDLIKAKYIITIAKTLVHETIHSLRVITRKGSKIDNIYLSNTILDLENKTDYYEDKEERKRVACYILQDESKEDLEKMIKNGQTKEAHTKAYELHELINYQEGLEECITEALAQIAIDSFLYKKTYKQIIIDIIGNQEMRLDAVVGAVIIQNISKETIMWFLSTKTTSNYEDIFKQEFQDNYFKIIKIINDAYRNTNNYQDDKKARNIIVSKLYELLENRKKYNIRSK